MKTVFIDCSPKKKFCASAYLLFMQKLFVRGSKVKEKLRTPADHERILQQLDDADSAVFCVPLYVDGVPSHVLRFLTQLERRCREGGHPLNVYVAANNGFIEGRQNEPLMQVFENFCGRAGCVFGGGVGVGGGVMLNVYRIVFTVQTALFLLSMVLNLAGGREVLPGSLLMSYLENFLIILYLNIGLLVYMVRMGYHINRGSFAGKRYTRIMIPSFLFIIFADIFFVIISVIKGGIFRGWLSRKEPDGD